MAGSATAATKGSLNRKEDYGPETPSCAGPVIARIQVILFSIAVATGLLDVVWIRLGHFDVDAPAYSALALLAALLAGGGAYYQHRRDDPVAYDSCPVNDPMPSSRCNLPFVREKK